MILSNKLIRNNKEFTFTEKNSENFLFFYFLLLIEWP